MSDCGVCLDYDCSETQWFGQQEAVSRKPFKCSECAVEQPKGTAYVRSYGKCDGNFFSYKVCALCEEIMRVFTCDGPVMYGGVFWADMDESVFPDLTMNNPCIHRLSNEGRAKLTTQWWKWRADRQLDHESEPPKA